MNGDGEPSYAAGSASAGLWTWSANTTVTGAGEGEYSGVSCASATSCVAVGSNSGGEATATTGTDTSGSWIWSSPSTITPDAFGGTQFVAISCPTTYACTAVGDDNGGGVTSYASGSETGGVWSWAPVNEVVNDPTLEGRFNGVSCPTTTSCVAVGSYGDNSAVADAWSPPAPNTPPPTTVPGTPDLTGAQAGLNSVSLVWSAPGSDGAASSPVMSLTKTTSRPRPSPRTSVRALSQRGRELHRVRTHQLRHLRVQRRGDQRRGRWHILDAIEFGAHTSSSRCARYRKCRGDQYRIARDLGRANGQRRERGHGLQGQ